MTTAAKPKATKNKAPVPSVLAFNRKLEVSDALMHSGLWTDLNNPSAWLPIELHEKRNRATFSQYGAKEEDKPKPNLSWGDDATLAHDADTLKIRFTLKILGNLEEPNACNEPHFEQKIRASVASYRESIGFSTLALRYAHNISNARFLWRNRVGAEALTVVVKHKNDTWTFDAYKYQLNEFTQATTGSDFEKLVQVFESALLGDGSEFLEVIAFAKLGAGQRVWPSQEMIMNIPKGEKTRHLFQLNGCAAMHSEKIGNALRTIDTWYGTQATSKVKDDLFSPSDIADLNQCIQAIAIEPFGSVTSRGQAYRMSKNDFYTLFVSWLADTQSVSLDEQHFIIAILIRGGVFSGSDDKKDKGTGD